MEKAIVTNKEIDSLFAQLRLHNVTKIVMNFEGAGDSGSIDDVILLNASGGNVTIPTTTILWTSEDYHDAGKPKDTTLRKALEDLGYQMLDKTGVDWYNNDGGYGDIAIDISDIDNINVLFDMNQRYTEVENSQFIFDDFENIFKGEGVTA
jgi:hypothetical protein